MLSRQQPTGQSDKNVVFWFSDPRLPGRISSRIGNAAIAVAAFAVFAAPLHAAVWTNYGVQAQLWSSVNGLMKMDYDWTYSRFVVQYNYAYGWGAPQYATIDLATKALTHHAVTSGNGYETLLSVLPTSWAGFAPGTALVPQGGGGAVLAITPSGTVVPFATGLPGGGAGPTNYSAARWDALGAIGNDLLYTNEGTGHVARIDSTGTPVWVSVVSRPDGLAGRPEPVIALGNNPRWGTYQNSILVGENDATTNVWQLDPVTGAVGFTTPDLGAAIGRTAEAFRIYPFTGSNYALYLSVHSGSASTIWQLTNLFAIPNLQPGDLFVAVEQSYGGEVWHVYFDATNNLVTQQVAVISGDGFLEDMVFAPIPEPGTAAGALLGFLFLTLRRR